VYKIFSAKKLKPFFFEDGFFIFITAYFLKKIFCLNGRIICVESANKKHLYNLFFISTSTSNNKIIFNHSLDDHLHKFFGESFKSLKHNAAKHFNTHPIFLFTIIFITRKTIFKKKP
jgi:hypothetical protein